MNCSGSSFKTGNPATYVLIFLLAPVIIYCSGKSPDIPKTTIAAVKIDNTVEYQTMDGFGATHLSLVHDRVGDVLSPDIRASAIDAIYKKVGINLGNLEGALLESPGGWDKRTNDNDDPFKFNWKGFQTSNAAAMKTKVLDLAETTGFDDYFLGQKINIRWASPWMRAIRSSDYNRYLDEAAEQVAAGQIYWRDTYGIVPKYLMLFNEPLSGNRELRNGTVKEVVDIIKRAGARLRSEGFSDIKFVVPNEETEEKTLDTIITALADPEARQYIGAIGYHTYPYGSFYSSISRILSTSGTGNPDPGRIAVRNRIRDLGRRYGIPVWMTEVSRGGVDPLSFDSFRGRVIHIHDELIYADASAYFGMNSMMDTVSYQMHYRNGDLFTQNDSIVLINNDTKTIYISGMGYAIGHYARWIERGTIRIGAASNDALIQITAFRDDTLKRFVLVLINNESFEKVVNIEVNGLKLGSELIGEQSTKTGYWQALEPFAPEDSNNFKLTVPAESVTTISGQVMT